MKASDIMTSPVITVGPDTLVRDIAGLLYEHRISAVPVLEQGKLVGIVSRSNLVQALAAKGRLIDEGDSGDGAIRARLTAELERQAWWQPTLANVIVTDGVVHYYGVVDHEEQRQPARIAAENVPGVRGIEDHRFLSTVLAWSM
jgi:CBS domain-containing protein